MPGPLGDRTPLTIVVPALNEAATLPALLDDLARLRVGHEVVVVDGGSADGTPRVAAARGAVVVEGARGRGAQLVAGASAARGRVLAFLHADVRLEAPALRALERCAGMPDGEARAFTLRIAGEGWRYRFVEWGTDRRSRWGRMPYGDQGLVVTRRTYAAAGGYPAVPLMEDVAFVRALRRSARVVIMPERVLVSPRRWERDGVLRRMLRNWALVGAYLAGVPPAALARRYPPPDPVTGASAEPAGQPDEGSLRPASH